MKHFYSPKTFLPLQIIVILFLFKAQTCYSANTTTLSSITIANVASQQTATSPTPPQSLQPTLAPSTATTTTLISTPTSSTTSSSLGPSLPQKPLHQFLRPKFYVSKAKICKNETDCSNQGVCKLGDCFCKPGFTGDDCAINIDECRLVAQPPCANGGACIDGQNSYSCNCLPGYRGDFCEEIIDMCINNECQNNSTCFNHKVNYTCQCQPGYRGEFCNEVVDMCLNAECQNNALCINHKVDYTCQCEPGFEGRHCEKNIDECSDKPCKNNSTCVDLVNDYECHCGDSGFEGKNCTLNIDDCALKPCVYAKECIDKVGDFECVCYEGFRGTKCENDINECHPNPCMNNGICEEKSAHISPRMFDLLATKENNQESGIDFGQYAGFTCQCEPGFEGRHCEKNIDDCFKKPCKNNGTCIDLTNDYKCDCGDSGFDGKNCDNNIDDCISKPCHYAKGCIDRIGDFKCICYEGFTGRRCELDIQECAENPCMNNGLCIEKSSNLSEALIRNDINQELNVDYGQYAGYSCQCLQEYFGDRCEERKKCLGSLTLELCDILWVVGMTCIGLLIATFSVIFLMVFKSVRKARATRGTYSPSTQEKFGNSASDILKPPPEERLI